ncbi:acyl-CoA dehydrogenase family protein [Streptomyces sp. NBC_00038]|uniref:acyl-CoA dehydrogenase family protein n=1 Tax=Streptomyces sp. NBC_00038 TaxID=2903615 RepID=UPI00224D8B65|nr:acyl-CoA dehydrogenase family protein [Streptomyces sp. NBC_00038]MCX5554565.1 acyl-CoA/acyl-ACP dehydrogenase [Streptomyces sp. NBC_00038]
MRFAPTDEQLELGRTAQRLLAAHARNNVLPPPWDAIPQTLDRELQASLAELGLLGLGVPERRGGSGGGIADLCVVAEQVGSALPVLPFTATAAVAAVLAERPESPAIRSALTGVVDGSVIAVPAWETFPADMVPGRRAGSLSLTGMTVDGVLAAVPFGLDADLLLAFADDAGARPRPVLVELAEPTTERTPVDSLDVTEPMASLRLTGARALPLGPLSAHMIARMLTVLSAELIGTGRRSLEGAVEYAGQRRQFGRPIGSFQAIKHVLADRSVQLDAARMLVQAAAHALDTEDTDADVAARTALAAAADAVEAVTADGLQTHGGIGFTWEHRSHVLLRRARARRSLLGSPAHRFDVLADRLLGSSNRS